jgi:uncharacterized protein (DUF1330 family)
MNQGLKMSTPKGYVYVELVVRDPENFKEYYQPKSTAAVAAFNGKFLMRGGEVDIKSGPSDERRRVLIEFETYETAHAFWDSPLQQEAKTYREKYAHVITFYLMQGS